MPAQQEHKYFGPRAKAVAKLVKRHFAELEKRGELSGAHSFGHVARVAFYAGQIARRLGANRETVELAQTAGLMHDFVRSKAETVDTALDDEVLAARQAKPILESLGKGQELSPYEFFPDEIAAIQSAIQTHKVPKEILANESRRHAVPTATNLVRLAVWLADKTEANGGYVIARRGQFVAGERYEKGDLANWRQRLPPAFRNRITPHVAFLMESYVRRYLKNDSAMYPNWYKPVSDELFHQQREFVKALYAATNLTEPQLETLMLMLKYPGVAKEDIRKAAAKREARPEAISEQEINTVSTGHREAALRIVDHFSHPDHRGLDTARAITRFIPKTPEERHWHDLMKGYLGGNLKRKIDEIRRPI